MEASVQKVILMVFLYNWGPPAEHYTSQGITVTSASLCELLMDHLKCAIRSKHGGLLGTCVFLWHDNARPCTACVTAKTIEDIHIFWVTHQGSW